MPVQQIVPGQWYTATVEPMSFWRSRLDVSRNKALYQVNVTFVGPPTASVAVYGRLGAPPTVTNYDWAHIVSEAGNEKRLRKRSSGGYGDGMVSVERPLSRGDWFIGVLNDNEAETRTLRAVVGEKRLLVDPRQHLRNSASGSGLCPNDCSGNGECGPDGTCRCEARFAGKDCSESKLTVRREMKLARCNLASRPEPLSEMRGKYTYVVFTWVDAFYAAAPPLSTDRRCSLPRRRRRRIALFTIVGQ